MRGRGGGEEGGGDNYLLLVQLQMQETTVYR